MNQPAEPNPPEDPRDPDRPYFLEDPLVRFDARVLDPLTAVRQKDRDIPSPTLYVGDTLLLTADTVDTASGLVTLLDRAVEQSQLPVRRVDDGDPFQSNGDPDHDRRVQLMQSAEQFGLPVILPVRFLPPAEPAPAADVWPLLQSIRRAAAGEDADPEAVRLSNAIGLNHLMLSAADISGNPYSKGMATIFGNPYSKGMSTIFGNPYSKGMAAGIASYSAAGSGGRGPVAVVLPAPLRTSGRPIPTVVVLDTGVGRHPWFDAQPVTRGLEIVAANGTRHWVGMNPNDAAVQRSDPEGAGAIPDPMAGLLDSHSGHGTFIAGLLRQICADADIIALRIMDSDGVVPEVALTDALTWLGVAQASGQASIDALVLSLGYYPETREDATYTAGLREQVVALAAMGIGIFCAAGNDSTQRRSYPAAFCVDARFADEQRVPMASVAALNPDSSVALFSNDGDWVNAEAPGANLVSTAPVLAKGAWTPDTAFLGIGNTGRGTVDPDSFVAGFSTWSGTSFAAPVLAGRYLARLAERAVPRVVKDRAALVGLGRGQNPQ